MGSFCFFSLSAKAFVPSSSVSPSTKPSSPWSSSRSSMSWSISEWTWATPRVFAQLLSLPDQQLNPSNFALHPNCLHHHHYLPLPHRQSEKNITRIAKEGHPLFVVALFGGAGGSYSLHYTTISATHMIHIIVVIDVYRKLQWAKKMIWPASYLLLRLMCCSLQSISGALLTPRNKRNITFSDLHHSHEIWSDCTPPHHNQILLNLPSVAPIIGLFNSIEFDWSSSPTPQQVYLFLCKCIFGGEVWGGLRLATAWCPENFLKRMSKEGESSQEFKMYNILIFNKNSTSLFSKIQRTDMWYICEFCHSFTLGPKLSFKMCPIPLGFHCLIQWGNFKNSHSLGLLWQKIWQNHCLIGFHLERDLHARS